SDGTTIIATPNGKISYFTPNGVFKFSMRTMGQFLSSPLVLNDNTVIAANTDGMIYILSARCMITKQIYVGVPMKATPKMLKDGRLVVTSANGMVYFINFPAGNIDKSVPLGLPILTSPAVLDDDTVVVSSEDGKVYYINPDATIKATFATNAKVVISPVVLADQTVVVGSTDKNIYFLDKLGKTKFPAYAVGAPVTFALATTADKTGVVAGVGDNIYVLNGNGTLRVRVPLSKPVVNAPSVFADGTISFSSENLKVYFLEANGQLLASYLSDSIISSSAAQLPNKSIVFGRTDGKIFWATIQTPTTPPPSPGGEPI
ncbi:MAG: PQQ-binding-like beta-propeller repeat protein, partial [Pseudomonadota bacterium]